MKDLAKRLFSGTEWSPDGIWEHGSPPLYSHALDGWGCKVLTLSLLDLHRELPAICHWITLAPSTQEEGPTRPCRGHYPRLYAYYHRELARYQRVFPLLLRLGKTYLMQADITPWTSPPPHGKVLSVHVRLRLPPSGHWRDPDGPLPLTARIGYLRDFLHAQGVEVNEQ